MLLAYLALSRLGIYIPLGGVNREAFVGNLDQNSLLSTLDSFSGGGIGRLGVCSLGIVPFINAQIVFQLLAQVYPKLQDLQKKEGEAGRKKFCGILNMLRLGLQSSRQLAKCSSFAHMSMTSVQSGIISYFPASVGRTVAQAFQDGNYGGLATIVVSFFLLVLGIVYVQEAERKIPIIMPRDTPAKVEVLKGLLTYPLSYLTSSTMQVNSSGVMPIIFSTSSLAIPGTLARFITGLAPLKTAAVALNPGGSFYLPTNILLIAFFNYYYTFLQLDPDDVSEQLKRQGASIPLVLSRISVLGSAFLAILAAGPAVVEQKYKNIEFYNIDKYGP
ncbi:hypothetical protein M0R45_019198 [Rubus argutus]|uniref:Uncharacterized protein n=1 Tax=Rubus argutus TaxID=59490 RepID=A0AAW1X6N1_RUBAR